jgi:hypothetical protein
MEYLDARRLTGPNILSGKAGSILDVSCTGDEADRLIPFCESKIRLMLDAIGWGQESVGNIRLAGGVSIAFSGPIDALYAASAINEWVWACCDAEFNGAASPDFDEAIANIKEAIAAEVNPPLLALEQAAVEHGVSFLWDDDEASVGLGAGSETWAVRELPDPSEVDWSNIHDIPAAIVTGTNGKTTTVRIADHILQTAGRMVGMSSTDWISVNGSIIDRDDWSGPGGARMVLRQKDVDVAILETARGGLLRRGLGVNTAEDHIGDFGSQSRDELLNIKWVISRAVADSGVLILNADDQLLVGKSREFSGTIVWFSLDENNPVIRKHTEDGGLAFVYGDGELLRIDGDVRASICDAREIPITLGGAAAHNIANALGAAALTEQLGMSLDDIRNGLTSMSQDANPGRSNLYPLRGFKVSRTDAKCMVDRAGPGLYRGARKVPARPRNR